MATKKKAKAVQLTYLRKNLKHDYSYTDFSDALNDIASKEENSPNPEDEVLKCLVTGHDLIHYAKTIADPMIAEDQKLRIKDIVPILRALQKHNVSQYVKLEFQNNTMKQMYPLLNDLPIADDKLHTIINADTVLKHAAALHYEIPDTDDFTIDYVHREILLTANTAIDTADDRLTDYMKEQVIKDGDILSITPAGTGILNIRYRRRLPFEHGLSQFSHREQLLEKHGIRLGYNVNPMDVTTTPHKETDIKTFDMTCTERRTLQEWISYILDDKPDRNCELLVSQGILKKPIGYYHTKELSADNLDLEKELYDKKDYLVRSILKIRQNDEYAYHINIGYECVITDDSEDEES